MPTIRHPVHPKKRLVKPPGKPDWWSIIATLAVVIAVAGYLVVHFSHASTQTISLGAVTGGVPIPASGVYWGGASSDSKTDISTVPGCSGTTWLLIDCKVTWEANQLGLAAGHLQSDGEYHSTLDHYFYPDCGTASQADFMPGGKVYASAHMPGREVMLIDMKCGSNWGVLGDGGGNTSEDAKLKALVPLMDNIGVPVILSIFNEPEDNICAGSGWTPDDFRAMFRQAVADVRSQHPRNISIALTLQGYSLDQAKSLNSYETVFTGCNQADILKAQWNPDNFYPGDDAVDFMTFQEYNHAKGSFTASYTNYQNWMNKPCPTNHPATNYNCSTAIRSKKPMGSSEWGISGGAAFRDTFFANTISEIQNFPQIKYLAYWNNQDNPKFPDYIDYPYQTADPTVGSHDDYGIDTAHTSLKAWTKLSLSSYVFKPVFMQATPTPTPTVTGDVNGDGQVNVTDLSTILSHWASSYAPADLNHDNIVNVIDLSIVLSHWSG